VEIAVKRAITVTSWTMPGKRSEGRSSRHLLARSAIVALTTDRTRTSLATADSSATSPTPWRTATSSSRKPSSSQAEKISRPRM
jgi:hypothetical protein